MNNDRVQRCLRERDEAFSRPRKKTMKLRTSAILLTVAFAIIIVAALSMLALDPRP